MADETNPETPAPKKPAARKPSTTGPGAAPRKPAAKKPTAATTPVEVAPAAPEAAAAPEPVVPAVPEPVVPAVVVPEVPAEPAAPAAPVATPIDGTYPAPVATPKRKVWPWVLGGGILLFVLLIAGAIIAVAAILGAFGGDPKKAVTDYDKSFETADCELFQSTTTTEFQDSFFGEKFDCARWVENAEALTVDGVYAYDVKIVISKTNDDTAEVVTQETDTSSGDPVDYTLRYYLTKVDGHWLIDGIDNES